MLDQAVFRVDVGRKGLRVNAEALAAALAALPKGAPVVVMIHGYRFAPGAAGGNCPHRHIFSMQPPVQDWTAISWPRHLGLGGGRWRLALAGLRAGGFAALVRGQGARGGLWRNWRR